METPFKITTKGHTVLKAVKYQSMQNIFVALILLTTFLTPGLTSAQAQGDGWALKVEDPQNQISVYYRTHTSGNIEFRGITFIETSLSSLVACLQDVDSMPKWVYNLKSAKVLKKVSDVEAYTYTINSTPFPFSSRDSIVHTIIKQDPKSYQVTIRGKAVPDYLPEQKNLVRLTAVNSFWQFTPISTGKTKIVFQGFGEPGGNIPASVSRSSVFRWASEKLLWKLPMETLKNLHIHIRHEEYQRAALPFIKDFTVD